MEAFLTRAIRCMASLRAVTMLLAMIALAGRLAAQDGVYPFSTVVAGGSLGQFRHGTKVTGYYDKQGLLVDIQLRGIASTKPFASSKALVHAGIDLPADEGTPVYSLADGKVLRSVVWGAVGERKFLGNAVTVEHDIPLNGRRFYTAYFHFSKPPAIQPGENVVAGQTILGYVGHTGAAIGNHVHLEVRYFSESINPRWNNIYGRENGPNPTFDESQFNSAWADPIETIATLRKAAPPAQPAGPSLGDSFSELLSAAEGGNAEAQLRVGTAYATGSGTVVDGAQAIKWLERAANRSGPIAAAAAGWLGVVYQRGMGMTPDGPLAVQWFTRGAALGAGASAWNLAEMYLEGKLVKKDKKLAKTWYAKAAELYEQEAANGDAVAMYQLGRMYNSGVGVTQDKAKGRGLLERAAANGNAEAKALLAQPAAPASTGAAGPTGQSAQQAQGFPSATDPPTQGKLIFAQPCPSYLDEFGFASMERAYRIRVDLPRSELLLDKGALSALADRAMLFARQACGRPLTITSADITVFAPGYEEEKRPAATATYRGGIQAALASGGGPAMSYKNFALASANWAKLNQATKVDTVMKIEELAANPFAQQGKTIAVVVEFQSMETASLGIFSGLMSKDERGAMGALTRVAIDGLPASLFTAPGQRAVIVGTVAGRRETPIGEDRLPLLEFRAIHVCGDPDCGDM